MLYVQHMYLCCIYVYTYNVCIFMYNCMYIYMHVGLYFTIAHSKEVY